MSWNPPAKQRYGFSPPPRFPVNCRSSREAVIVSFLFKIGEEDSGVNKGIVWAYGVEPTRFPYSQLGGYPHYETAILNEMSLEAGRGRSDGLRDALLTDALYEVPVAFSFPDLQLDVTLNQNYGDLLYASITGEEFWDGSADEQMFFHLKDYLLCPAAASAWRQTNEFNSRLTQQGGQLSFHVRRYGDRAAVPTFPATALDNKTYAASFVFDNTSLTDK